MWVVLIYIWGTFDLLSVECQFVLIWCACLKRVCDSDMVVGRAKQSEIWDSGVVPIFMRGTFALLMFKVLLRPFFSRVSELPVTRKRQAAGLNRIKFRAWG